MLFGLREPKFDGASISGLAVFFNSVFLGLECMDTLIGQRCG